MKHFFRAVFPFVTHETRVFLRRFRDPIRVPRIRENYHRVPKIRENRVPRIREIGSLLPTNPNRVPNIFLKKKLHETYETTLAR